MSDKFSGAMDTDYVTAVIRARPGWTILSIKPYCGSRYSFVLEMLSDAGKVVTFYGDFPDLALSAARLSPPAKAVAYTNVTDEDWVMADD